MDKTFSKIGNQIYDEILETMGKIKRCYSKKI